ncbi:ACT domain-containing protein [Gudongella sp. DL1XJH-153]|uniref:ACT domain-containing protein n=1 Tax=Gudongella sp. DL1XJH-153 TaxID=3409804 RepID=UPI003BB4D6A6
MVDNIKKDSTVSELNLTESDNKPGFIFEYVDQKGVISKVSSILAANDINIASMIVTRNDNIATMKCEIEGDLDEHIKNQLCESFKFLNTKFIDQE